MWRSRWDSLRLFTSGRYDNLPGLPFPAAADTYPGKDDVADYLQAYAAQFSAARAAEHGRDVADQNRRVYVAKVGQEAIEARQVVLATGPFHVPFMPPIAAQLDADVAQLHSVTTGVPTTCRPAGSWWSARSNSGCQIALELSTTRTVELAVGQRMPTIPQRPLGRDVWTWATALRLDRVTADSRLGRRLSGRDQVIGAGPDSSPGVTAVRLRPRVTTAAGRAVTFADGPTAEYDAVLWATGFTADNTWIDVPGVTDEADGFDSTRRHTRSRSVHARPDLATHPRLRPARLGRQRRRLPRRADRSEHAHGQVQAPTHKDARRPATTVDATVSNG